MNNPYLIDQIFVMQQQEKAQAYRCSDYMALTNSSFSPDARQALCDWSYKIVAACGISRVTCVIAFSYFDRFLSSNSRGAVLALTNIGTAQLAFVTCLVLAIKTHSGMNVEPDFVSSTLCGEMYHAAEINVMEIEVLRSLGWRLNGPTPHDFIDSYLQVVPFIDSRHHDFLTRCSMALVEQAVTRYEVSQHYPSVIACTAICCALQYLEVMSSVDSITVLRCMKGVSGLDIEDPVTRRLFQTMVELMQEFLPGGSSSRGLDMINGRSAQSQGSPADIIHHYIRSGRSRGLIVVDGRSVSSQMSPTGIHGASFYQLY